MAKKAVDYGSRVVDVETSPVLEEATRDVAQQIGAQVDGEGRLRSDPGKAPGRSRDPQFEARKASMDQRLKASPPAPATVFNFLPVHLTLNTTMTGMQGGVKPATGEARFSTRTWLQPDILVNNLGDSGKEPRDFHPMQIAQAFEFEYPHGGVVALPCKPEEVAGNPVFKARLDEHEKNAVAWMRRQMDSGMRLWNAPDRFQRHNVNHVHRVCGQRLFDLKIIHALPEYMTQKRELNDVPVTCPKCGTTATNKNAVQCSGANCSFILDPAQAYKLGVIAEDDPSLERLTREQVQELGISAYVAETINEKPERVKAGLPKPYSDAAMLALETTESHEQPGA